MLSVDKGPANPYKVLYEMQKFTRVLTSDSVNCLYCFIFIRSIQENRLKRQEYGKSYRCHVLKELGSVYVSKLCTQPTSDDLEEIITLAGGSLVNSFHKASFIVGPVPDREYVKEVWILNCILQGMVIDAKKYIRDHA